MGCGNAQRQGKEAPQPEKRVASDNSELNSSQEKAKEEDEYINQIDLLKNKKNENSVPQPIKKEPTEQDDSFRNLKEFVDPSNDGSIVMKDGREEALLKKIEEKDRLNCIDSMMKSSKASKTDLEIFEYMNITRQHPEYIVHKLKKALESKKLAGDYTEEALKDAIHEMSSKKSVDPVAWDEGIFKACSHHVNDLGSTGKISHKGSDGKAIMERMNRYGKYHGIYGENIQAGKSTAKEIILDLIIDINSEKKLRRRTLMDPKFKRGGVSSGTHCKFGVCTVFGYIG